MVTDDDLNETINLLNCYCEVKNTKWFNWTALGACLQKQRDKKIKKENYKGMLMFWSREKFNIERDVMQ